MTVKERIDAAVFLGDTLKNGDEFLDALVHRTSFHNKWFTKENQEKAIQAISNQFLDREKLGDWTSRYHIDDNPNTKTVGLIMAGNIPLVGFHDFLSVFISGHKSQIKLSDKDPFVFPYLLKILEKANPEAGRYFEIVEKLEGFDAVIATGSNNSARYFDAYFGKYPNIIRRNRNSIGVLTGKETDAELLALGNDIFQYFGLGCRNVSKVYLPEGYDRKHLLEILHEYRELVLHDKYKHNFDYNFALLSLNRIPFDINGCIILTE
ncbi:MAG: acyl-CoA reductase, partial [Saprospiraceae bacterium]|nr:acyl-CoA reductase [Saprospiraceae bacterium]